MYSYGGGLLHCICRKYFEEDFPLLANVFLLAPSNQLQCTAVLIQREDLPILLDYLHELLQAKGEESSGVHVTTAFSAPYV